MLILVDNFSSRTYINEELFNFMPVETAKELSKLDAYVVVEEDDYLSVASVFSYDVRNENKVSFFAGIEENLPISTLVKTALNAFKNKLEF